ncbi:ATP-binding protein [Tatumella saanichensis]|uniref:ATP-binding protein n=1 Tax=Tatumella saanichensis TaxID=480813 RepID=UPI0004A2D0A7|nr:ATP-binding protein [Tatumella saanichensis]
MTVQELAGSALQSLESTGISTNITLALPDPLILAFIDGALLERVLVNLLENAVKYGGDAPQITLSATVGAGRLTLHVTDDGPSIPQGQQQSIFEKFFRGSKESSIPSIGLGLAICDAIVHLHQGTISASNQPSGGAEFCIDIPQQAPPMLKDLE